MSMGERLRKARLKMGYSQEEVARRIDTHRTTIGKYENGECEPSIKVYKSLSEADRNLLYRCELYSLWQGYESDECIKSTRELYERCLYVDFRISY